MINKKVGKDIFLVVLSNGVKLISSVLTVFFLPLLFSGQSYSFYKLFLLYVSYVGLFHFGFNDGVYLYYAGKSYEELNKSRFIAYTKFLSVFQAIIACIVVSVSFFLSGDRQFIVLLVGLNLFALNLTTYYQFISQVTQRFKEFAVRNIILTILNVILIALFYFLRISDYKPFLIFTVLINFLLLFWYSITYRDIFFAKGNRFKAEKNNILLMFKLGIVLLFSNLVVNFFSVIPIQFVEIKYPVEQYYEIFSNFSFAYTLMGFTGVFLSAISIVLYPTLKKSSSDELKKNYNDFNSVIIVLVLFLIVAYYPLSYIVQRFLPDYTPSLDVFFVLAPGIAITSSATVIIHNYYKTLNKNKEFLLIGVINLVLLGATIYVVHTFINNNIVLISISTVVVQLIWYLMLDGYLNKNYKNISIRNIVFIFAGSTAFYLTHFLKNLFIGFGVYIVTISLLTVLFYGSRFKDLYLLISKKKTAAARKAKDNDVRS